MARPLRPDFPGAVHHVTARGNAGNDIFLDDADRRALLDVFGRVCGDFGWQCHAYCLMSNHYHLLIETPEGGLSRGMRHLNGIYTQAFNRAHGRSGHIFRGRFNSILIDKGAYLLELCRHVVCNPVRARLVRRAREFPWSSYRATVDLDPRPDWLQTDWILNQFGSHRRDAIKAFVRYIAEARPAPHLETEVRDQVFLGSEAFVAEAKMRVAGRATPRRAPRTQPRKPPRRLAAYAAEWPERDPAIVAAYRSNDHTQQAIAKHFGLHDTTVCRIIEKARAQEPNR